MLKRLPRQVILLALMTCVMNVAFLMVYSLSTVYLNEVIGASATVIGFWAGLAEGMSYAVKLISGFLTDHFKKRKLLVGLGYSLILLSKPLWVIYPSLGGAITARLLERLGNGIQSTPAEVWVSDVTDQKERTAAYGIKRSFGMAGALIGGSVSSYIMAASYQSYRTVFLFSMIPAAFALLLLLVFLKEPVLSYQRQTHFFEFLSKSYWQRLPKNFWQLIVLTTLWAISRTMETFIVILGRQIHGIEVHNIPLIFVVIYIFYATFALLCGWLTKKSSKTKMIFVGLFIFGASHLLFSLGHQTSYFWTAVALWGVQMGFIQTLLVAIISLCVPHQMIGMALGIFYLMNSLPMIIGGSLVGLSIETIGINSTFLLSSLCCAGALMWWLGVKRNFSHL